MRKIIKIFIIIGLLVSICINSYAEDTPYMCKVDPAILAIIAKIEGHAKRDVGYPYIISFNNIDDSKKIKSIIGNELFLDSRTIDCKESKLCEKVTSFIVEQTNVKNMDLGAYQINYYYHKMPVSHYFSFEKSYIKACGLLEELIATYGYTWQTIARYHSATPKYNYAYLQKISTIIGESRVQ